MVQGISNIDYAYKFYQPLHIYLKNCFFAKNLPNGGLSVL